MTFDTIPRNVIYILLFFALQLHGQTYVDSFDEMKRLKNINEGEMVYLKSYYKGGITGGGYFKAMPIKTYHSLDKNNSLRYYYRNLKKGTKITLQVRVKSMSNHGFYFVKVDGIKSAFGFQTSSNKLRLNSESKYNSFDVEIIDHEISNVPLNTWVTVIGTLKKDSSGKFLTLGRNLINDDKIDVRSVKVEGYSLPLTKSKRDNTNDNGLTVTLDNVILKRVLKGYVSPEMFGGNIQMALDSKHPFKAESLSYNIDTTYSINRSKIYDFNGAEFLVTKDIDVLYIRSSHVHLNDLLINTSKVDHNSNAVTFDMNFRLKSPTLRNVKVIGNRKNLLSLIGTTAFIINVDNIHVNDAFVHEIKMINCKAKHVKRGFVADKIPPTKLPQKAWHNTHTVELDTWGVQEAFYIKSGSGYRIRSKIQAEHIFPTRKSIKYAITLFTGNSDIDISPFDFWSKKKKSYFSHNEKYILMDDRDDIRLSKRTTYAYRPTKVKKQQQK